MWCLNNARIMILSAAIAQSQILGLVLHLFTAFPFNNILHHLVLNLCSFVLEHGSDTVLTHLLNDCKLVEWLVSAPEEVEPKQAKGITPLIASLHW